MCELRPIEGVWGLDKFSTSAVPTVRLFTVGVFPKPRAFTSGARDLARAKSVARYILRFA